MNYYELLFVLPGTLSEEEAKTSVDKVKIILANSGVADVKIEDLGKNRLAYPIKQIRYGYFQICHFQTEGKEAVEIQNKLRLADEILRFLVQKYNPKKPKRTKIDYADMDKPARGATARKEITREEVFLASAPVSKNIKTKPEIKKEEKKVSLEDIDKQLDEILEGGISGV